MSIIMNRSASCERAAESLERCRRDLVSGSILHPYSLVRSLQVLGVWLIIYEIGARWSGQNTALLRVRTSIKSSRRVPARGR